MIPPVRSFLIREITFPASFSFLLGLQAQDLRFTITTAQPMPTQRKEGRWTSLFISPTWLGLGGKAICLCACTIQHSFDITWFTISCTFKEGEMFDMATHTGAVAAVSTSPFPPITSGSECEESNSVPRGGRGNKTPAGKANLSALGCSLLAAHAFSRQESRGRQWG